MNKKLVEAVRKSPETQKQREKSAEKNYGIIRKTTTYRPNYSKRQ